MILVSLVAAVASSVNGRAAAVAIPVPPAVCQFPQKEAEFVPFAEETRMALGRARALAVAAHNNAIGSAHVALGLLQGGNAASDALQFAHVDTARLAGRLRAALPKTSSRVYGPDLPYDISGKAVLCFAIRHAKQRSSREVTTLDLLDGLTQGGTAGVVAALQREAIDSSTVEKLSGRRHRRDT